MPLLELTDAGLPLGPSVEAAVNNKSPGDLGTRQVIRICFEELSSLQLLAKSKEFKFNPGRSITFTCGDAVQEVLSTTERQRNELYEMGDGPMDFKGLFSHKFVVRVVEKEQDDAADLVALKNQMSALSNQKKSRTTMLVDTTGPHRSKKLPVKVSEPIRQQKVSSQLGKRTDTTTTTTDKSSRKSRSVEQNTSITNALRAPLIHLLALGSDNERSLAIKTHAPVEICLRILQRIGNRTRAGTQWELVDDIYKDLDLWKFPYGSQKDREKALSNAKAAFERLRLPADADEWHKLVAPEDRGKVTPPGPSHPSIKAKASVKANPVEADAKHGERSPTTSEKNASEPMSRTTSQPPQKIRKIGEKDKISRIIANKGKPQKEKKEKVAAGPKKIGRPPKVTKWLDPSAATPKTGRNNTMAASKNFKSSEFVESESESDEKAVSVKKPGVSSQPVPNNGRVVTATKTGQKSNLGAVKIDPPKGNKASSISPKKTNVVSGKTVPVQRHSDTEGKVKGRKRAASPPPRKNGTASKTIMAPESPYDRNGNSTKRDKFVNATGNIGGKRPRTNAVPARANGVKDGRVGGKGLDKRDNSSKRSPITSPVKPSPLGSSPPINASDMDDRSSRTPHSLSTIGSTPRSPLDSITVSHRARPRSVPDQQTARRRKAEDEGDNTPPVKRQCPRLPSRETMDLARQFKEEYAKYSALYEETKKMPDTAPKYEENRGAIDQMFRSLTSMKARLTRLSA